MSYYEFNNHFWSSEAVCACSTRPKQKAAHKNKIGLVLYVIYLAVSIVFLLDILVSQENQTTGQSFRKSNVIGNCLMLESTRKIQVYCNSN
jgi:hypothetical protein